MNHLPEYRQFLEGKIRLAVPAGFTISDDDINPLLSPFQKAIVKWMVRGGCRAVFASFGLGKSIMQIEALRIIQAHTGADILAVLPLGVRQEFRADAEMLCTGDRPNVSEQQRAELKAWQAGRPDRMPAVKFIRRPDEIERRPGLLHLTNYETVRDGKLDPNLFGAVSLDEASVLRSFGSKTYQQFLSLFGKVQYKFVATATPAPNRFKELIHYAGFLGVMDTGQALTRFFQRDSKKANNLTLYPHKEHEFWLWVSSWAVMIRKPSDIGFPDDGYDLPPLKVNWHEIQSDIAGDDFERDGQGRLLRDQALGLAEEAGERRATLPARIEKLLDIIAADAPEDRRILWHDLEDERRAIEKAVPDVVAVYGAQPDDDKEAAIIGFSNGQFRHLAGKPVMLGSGCNFQRHCHKAVFIGINHKFNDFIQAIHRLLRFLQPHEVEIDIIYTERERETRRDLEAKWAAHETQMDKIGAIIRKFGLNHEIAAEALRRSIGCARVEASGANWLAANNDCVEETRLMADNSVGQIVTSIPFSNHYEYTPSYNDFGHTDDDAHFFAQMDYLTPELLRILQPGRLACVHVKDRVMFGSVTGLGFPTINPFHAKCIAHYLRHGFAYMGLIFIDTDVVFENNQTYRLSYSEMRKDGTKMGVGSPEFVLLLRKPQTDASKGYADDPVQKRIEDYSLAAWQIDAHARWRSSGDRLLTPDELAALDPKTLPAVFREQSAAQLYDYEQHVAMGEALAERRRLPTKYMALQPGTNRPDVWADVNRLKTLNGSQDQKRREKHVCPLQFDIVDRCIERFSAPGDMVFDPFAGLMTVPYRALKLGRRGRGVELNPGYFADGVGYLREMEDGLAVPSLLDLMQTEAAE